MDPSITPRRRWVYYAACFWSLCFAAPHTWWALGSSFGFPGGAANYRLWMTTWWRYLYDVIVVLLSVLGAVVALALQRRGNARLRGGFRVLAWMAAGLLALRGAAGLVVDGAADPIWWPTFLVGGLLFGGVARLSRPGAVSSTTATAPSGTESIE